MANMEWHSAAKRYLERLGMAEWNSQGRPIPSGKRYQFGRRYVPSDYHRELIDCLNRNDEQAFKARKMLEGYASAVGV